MITTDATQFLFLKYNKHMTDRREKVSFKATEAVPKTVAVEFYTKTGEKVQFKAVKEVPKTVKVEFYANKKK